MTDWLHFTADRVAIARQNLEAHKGRNGRMLLQGVDADPFGGTQKALEEELRLAEREHHSAQMVYEDFRSSQISSAEPHPLSAAPASVISDLANLTKSLPRMIDVNDATAQLAEATQLATATFRSPDLNAALSAVADIELNQSPTNTTDRSRPKGTPVDDHATVATETVDQPTVIPLDGAISSPVVEITPDTSMTRATAAAPPNSRLERLRESQWFTPAATVVTLISAVLGAFASGITVWEWIPW